MAPGAQLSRSTRARGGRALASHIWRTQGPRDAIQQMSMLRAAPGAAEDLVSRISGGRRDIVARRLETLALLGELEVHTSGRYRPASGSLVSG